MLTHVIAFIRGQNQLYTNFRKFNFSGMTPMEDADVGKKNY